MQGGCTKYCNNRRDHVSDGLGSESCDPSHSGLDEWPDKKLEFGLDTADTVDIIGNGDDSGRYSAGNVAGHTDEGQPWSACDVGQMNSEQQRSTGEHDGQLHQIAPLVDQGCPSHDRWQIRFTRRSLQLNVREKFPQRVLGAISSCTKLVGDWGII